MTLKRKVRERKPDLQVPDLPRQPQPVPTKAFQVVTFFDAAEKRQIIILYALGEDGIVREFIGNKWNPYPVTKL